MDWTWKYSLERTPPAPVVKFDLAGFPIELTVDTGFAGGILIPFSLFRSLALLSALTPDLYHAVMPDSRRIRLYTARAEVSMGSAKFSADVHSSPLLEKRLIGRSFLRSFVALLDGEKEKLRLRSV